MAQDNVLITLAQEKLVKLIDFEEGWREVPYLCSEGYPTIGFGFRIGPKESALHHYQFTLPRQAGEIWLSSLLASVTSEAEHTPDIKRALASCNEARQAVLISMAYQMGTSALNQFKKTLTAIENRRWDEAHDEMLNSRWAQQTPARAQRHAQQMLTGTWYAGYKVSDLYNIK
ncbi:glycoside hydrolase family protein [Vibrio mangrovi]|uniref:Lysozyme n=1 Tax=Vibrio mangrovi TaxID=474394 RepID=A0A1Y6ITM2_9VIBR|nr:glycoside hydrolase family protein [Vibrio mangrovi]MDW6004736.1 glycoside hydrolase family protein [Vibrio mangrovi]SMS01027.1 hypothetical protein VIM7927_02304 [Vibrio mangrovi]